MSRIFDALQRSESELAGVDSHVPTEVTELLRHAEDRAASQWESSDKAAVEATAPVTAIAGDPARVERTLPITRAANFAGFQLLHHAFTPQDRMVCFDDGESAAAEAFRLLAVRVRHLRRERPLKRLLITSTIQQEGKSTVAENLAGTLAHATQQKVLLLDGDHRRPAITAAFHLASGPGLSEYLRGEQEIERCIYHLEGHSLWILPAGNVQGDVLALLQSMELSALIEQLSSWFDWIVIDSPPVLPLADTSVWARLADGILIVARQGITERRTLQKGLEALDTKKTIGALLNCSKNMTYGDYYYGATYSSKGGRPSLA
jgi:capsular exopolysaccharide synthesis family protein